MNMLACFVHVYVGLHGNYLQFDVCKYSGKASEAQHTPWALLYYQHKGGKGILYYYQAEEAENR